MGNYIFFSLYLVQSLWCLVMTAKELYEKILSSSSGYRIKLLKDNKVRKSFLKYDAHSYFVNLVSNLEGIELKEFIDKEYLECILSSNRVIDKIVSIMESGNSYTTDILLDDNVINLIMDSTNKLNTYLNYLDYRMGKKIVDYDLSHKTNHFNVLNIFGSDEQDKIFDNEYIVKLLLNKDLPASFLIDIDGVVVNKLINYDKFLKMFLDLTIYDINSIIKKGFIVPNYLYHNKKLIDKYIYLSTNKYIESINLLMNNNYLFYQVIDSERLKYVDNKINSINNDIFYSYKDYKSDKDNIFKKYDYKTAYKLQYLYYDYDKVYDYLKYRTKEQVLEFTIEVFFKDIPYNFLKNLKVIMEYSKENTNYIPSNIDLYKTILNYNNLTMDEIIKVFNRYKNENLATSFYNDFRKARNISYNDINKSLLKLDKKSSIYQKDLSQALDTDIYLLDGNDFYLYIHSSSKGRWKENRLTLSLSLISHDNISCINSKKTIFGFGKLKIDYIMHMYHSDSFSTHLSGTNKVHDINTKERFIDKTLSYNEILYKEPDDLKPDYIVCFDNIDDYSVNLAKDLNIPIIIIDSRMYIKKTNGLEGLDVNTYLSGDSLEDYKILDDIKIR